jgi:hypothetical protein
METVWEVPTCIKKAFVLRAPQPSLLSRLMTLAKARVPGRSQKSRGV